jgi:hypothetical protein
MKAATFPFLLAVCGMVVLAQNGAAPSTDVTIRMTEDTPEYCLGEILTPPSFLPSVSTARVAGPKRGPDDITLLLRLAVRYENHRSETIILPSYVRYLTRMTVAGQSGSTISIRRSDRDRST